MRLWLRGAEVVAMTCMAAARYSCSTDIVLNSPNKFNMVRWCKLKSALKAPGFSVFCSFQL